MHYNDVPAVSMNNAANNDAASAALQSIDLFMWFLCVILGKFHRASSKVQIEPLDDFRIYNL